MNQDLITIGKRAQIAANKLALMNTATKNKALLQLADDLIKNKTKLSLLTNKTWPLLPRCQLNLRIV